MKRKIRGAAFLLLMVVMAGCIIQQSQRSWKGEAKTGGLSIENQANVGEIRKGTEIAQTFTVDRNFSGVSLLMATYNKRVYGRVHVKLLEEAGGQVLAEKTYYAGSMEDNALYHFLFDQEIEVSGPTRYRVVITSDAGRFRNGVTIWNSLEDQYPEGELYINGEQQPGDLVFRIAYEGKMEYQWGLFLRRAVLLILLFGFLGAHCFLDIPQMYRWIFEKRVWISLGLFAFLVLNRYHFSSIGQFDRYIQPGDGSQYVAPVAGQSRAIRSDEWMLGVPRFLSAEYSDYGKYNQIVRAEKTTNLSASGLYRSYSALAQPMDWGFYLFGSEIGLSFRWCFKMVFGFLFSFEFCLILTRKKKLLSLLGASLIWFSSCNMWWSTMNWILAGEAALVFVWYFLEAKDRRKRMLWGLGLAVSASCFLVVDLYPAWQVPAGYLYLMVLVWMIAEHWQEIRSYRWKDWLLTAGCLAFLISIAGVYLLNDMEYLTDIMNTKYPGQRVSYGGRTIQQLLGYLPTFLTSLEQYANPSEAGRFVSFFPIPWVLALVVFVRSRKKDLLTGLLLAGSTFLSLYCMVELPEFLARISLLTYSTPERTALVLGFAQILLLLAAVSRCEEWEGLSLPAGICTVLLTGIVTVWYSRQCYPDYPRWIYFAVLGILVFGALLPVISGFGENLRPWAMAGLSLLLIVTGLRVNPLMCGLDAIRSKPAAEAVAQITEQDSTGKWLAVENIAAGNFLIACGAPAVNSVNYIPNMDLWKKLDPKGEKEEIYNRYAHIQVFLTEEDTEMELVQADLINLRLSCEDLKKLGITYLFASHSLDELEDLPVKSLYEENGVYIYKMEY